MGARDRRIRSSKNSLGDTGSLRSAWDTADHFKMKNKNPAVGRVFCHCHVDAPSSVQNTHKGTRSLNRFSHPRSHLAFFVCSRKFQTDDRQTDTSRNRQEAELCTSPLCIS